MSSEPCTRCGEVRTGRYCDGCGLDSTPGEPVDSVNSLQLARDAEARWLGTHPEQSATHERLCPNCAETVKAAAAACRFCGHRLDGSPGHGDTPAYGFAPVPAVSPGSDSDTLRYIKGLVVAAVVIVGVLWASGKLDQPLSSVGLNRDPCVQNAFGATFCGDDAKRVCAEFGGEGCRDAGLDTAGSLEDELGLDEDTGTEDIGLDEFDE